MLQYPVLRPISSTNFKSKDHASYNSTDSRNEHSRLPAATAAMTSKRLYAPSKEALVSRPQYSGLSPSAPFAPIPSSSTPSPTLTASKLLRNPYISSRQASFSLPVPRSASSKSPASSRRSSLSSTVGDILFPGDYVGTGAMLQGEIVRLVSLEQPIEPPPSPSLDEPAQEFEVVRRLGAGSYAVVYLVREVLYRPPPSDDGHVAAVGAFDMDGSDSKGPSTVYGREYAIKCLSKENLDEEALAAQMSEVTIHQSLESHPNIVTHHRTLETSSFLLLLLEYVPGEDLFYFLEQARDHYEIDSPTSTDPSSRTPPTPSLLSNLHPSQLLSRTRLRLISSMFSQMCDAVAACHAQNVFHRDIKPENFIVTDGWHTASDGRQERKVIVKLTDFGLSTTEVDSADMDCGSAPYMSYECRNNVAPTYRPRAADVWSLGIVLINMLYHFNPWTDTHQGACHSFDLFCSSPVDFFLSRFTGMTLPVAEMLATRVFNVLEDPSDDSSRISAEEFGAWIKDLPDLLGNHPTPARHQRGLSISSTQGHSISTSVPPSHRPCSRQASRTSSAIRTPAMATRSLSRAPSLEHVYDCTVSDALHNISVVEEQDEPHESPNSEAMMTSRSTSTNKRRKRGARKGKGSIVSVPSTPKDETLETLAVASQSLAREISQASKVSSKISKVSTTPSDPSSTTSSARRRANAPYEPVSIFALPTPLLAKPRNAPQPLPFSSSPTSSSTLPAPAAHAHASTSTTSLPVNKKPSKWKLSFGKANSANLAQAAQAGRMSPVDEPAPSLPNKAPPIAARSSSVATKPSSVDVSTGMSATASNVTSLIMSLDAPRYPPPPPIPTEEEQWARGRRGRGSLVPHAGGSRSAVPKLSPSPHRLASSSSSMASNNWRSSMSTSSSAFSTRYSNSNASVRSVSTAATSVSSGSWRTGGKSVHSATSANTHSQGSYQNVPKNIKIMDGVPWELDQLPRGQYIDPEGDLFGQPPVRKRRTRKTKDIPEPLGTISERPKVDVSVGTISDVQEDESGSGPLNSAGKAQRGQINTLAKMLSALRR